MGFQSALPIDAKDSDTISSTNDLRIAANAKPSPGHFQAGWHGLRTAP
jgi:hypothetical protein